MSTRNIHPNSVEVGKRIQALREDFGYSITQMAEYTGRTPEQYEAQESGHADMSFTFLHKCADQLNVDVIELLTGESPHLSNYSLMRKNAGLSITRRAGFEYLHKAPHFKNKLAEPFVVTAPFVEEEQVEPIHLSQHAGQELDFILSGSLKFHYDGHEEILHEGDMLMYDSGKPHGMICVESDKCVFLAIVIPD